MKIKKNFPLSKLTTFKIGGISKFFAKIETKEDLKEVAAFAKENQIPILVLGEGSNVLISDKRFKGITIQLANKDIKVDGELVISAGGVNWDKLVDYCVNLNLQGIECLSAIPGTVGAAPYQNIGAYGQEFKDTFVKLEAFDTKLNRFVTLDKKACEFGYRNSLFKTPQYKNRYIIFSVVLKLKKDGKPNISYTSLQNYLKSQGLENPSLREVRKAVVAVRKEKLENPKINGNAGSFFKNPIVKLDVLKDLQKKFSDIPSYPEKGNKVKLFAGWLIEKAGWKGKRLNGVGVSAKNALVLMNISGQAKAEDIKILAEKIAKDIYKEFKIKIEPEVQYINF